MNAIVLVCHFIPEKAAEAAAVLSRAGFVTLTATPASVISTIDNVARTGGRIDAVVLAKDEFLFNRSDTGVDFQRTDDVVPAIRRIDGRLVFRGGVRARSVPITQFEFHGIMEGEFGALVDAVTNDIAAWRERLIAELEYVGFTVSFDQTGHVQAGFALRRKRRESEILADEATPGSLRKSQFLILREDVVERLEVYDKLKFAIENYEQMANKRGVQQETIFQELFEEHDYLIRRDVFDRTFPKPKLQKPEGGFYQPDFVQRPIVAATMGTKWEVLDLKLPSESLVTSKKFHRDLSSKLHRAIKQLRNYREYFNRHDSRPELLKEFGYQPMNPRLAVVIGRREDGEGLEQAQGPTDLDVDVISYDDIVEFEENRLVLQATLAGLFTR